MSYAREVIEGLGFFNNSFITYAVLTKLFEVKVTPSSDFSDELKFADPNLQIRIKIVTCLKI